MKDGGGGSGVPAAASGEAPDVLTERGELGEGEDSEDREGGADEEKAAGGEDVEGGEVVGDEEGVGGDEEGVVEEVGQEVGNAVIED